MDMEGLKDRIDAEADHFFEWPGADKSVVTTTSAKIFAAVIAEVARAELIAECERLVMLRGIDAETIERHQMQITELLGEGVSLKAELQRQHESHRTTWTQLEQAKRNRDMWKGQAECQAAKLEQLQQIVTTDHESKAGFIAHVRAVLNGEVAR